MKKVDKTSIGYINPYISETYMKSACGYKYISENFNNYIYILGLLYPCNVRNEFWMKIWPMNEIIRMSTLWSLISMQLFNNPIESIFFSYAPPFSITNWKMEEVKLDAAIVTNRICWTIIKKIDICICKSRGTWCNKRKYMKTLHSR